MTEWERGREREREVYWQSIDDWRSVSTTPLGAHTTPPLGARCPAYGGEYFTPTLRLAVWHAFRQHTRGPRPSPVRPNHRPALSRVRDPTPIPWPLVQRAGRDHPFPIFAGSPWRERDVARRMRHGWPAIPGEKTMGIEPHPAHVLPTAERLRRFRGVTRSSQSRGLASSSSCRERKWVVFYF